MNAFAQSDAESSTQHAQYDAPVNVDRIAAGEIDGDGRNDLLLLGGTSECYAMFASHTIPGGFESARPLR